MSEKKYIGYFIDHSFADLPGRSGDPVKLMETFSTKQEAWNKIGQILLIDYNYMDIICDYIKSYEGSTLEKRLCEHILGFSEFMKDFPTVKSRKNLTEARLTTLFMRKIMDSPYFMLYLKIKNDEDKEMECIFGVK